MKSIRPFLIALFLFALIPCAALADELDGVWLHSDSISDYQEPSAYQQLYPQAEYQLTIEGSRVTVRSHLPYIYPFSLTLNEENGWFESTGTLNANSGTLEITGGETLLIEASTDIFGTTRLVLSGSSLNNIGAALEFFRSEEGLTFDVSSLYGSWTDYRGSRLQFDLPFSMAASYVSGSDEFYSLHSFPEFEALYIREGCVTIVDPSYSSGAAYNMFSEKGRYALDITDFEVKDGGLFIELNGMKMKLYTGSDGFLRIVPLLSAQGI